MKGNMVGAVIGSYQIVRKLGEGGMGVVYLGQHTLLGRRAAIKVLLSTLSTQPDTVNRFFNEARAVTSISDPGIVQVFDFGYHTDGSAFIVMEYLEGEPLDRRLARLGKLPVVEALRLCRQIASSLAAAHTRHIIHRDLKPENVFLVCDGEVASGERTKILDFGIAKLSDEHPRAPKTHTGVLMGTPAYMSPEQCRGLTEIDHRSDVYALGCVLFHLLTGRPPFEGEGPGDIISAHIREPVIAPSYLAPETTPSVDALVLRCLAKAPSDRFQTMVELGAAIGAVLMPAAMLATVTPAYHVPPATGIGGGTPVMPTTLGGSSAQFVSIKQQSRRLALRVTGALVVAAAVVGVAIVKTRSSKVDRATSLSAEPASTVEPAVSGSAVDLSGTARGASGGSVARPEVAPPAVTLPAIDATERPMPASSPEMPSRYGATQSTDHVVAAPRKPESTLKKKAPPRDVTASPPAQQPPSAKTLLEKSPSMQRSASSPPTTCSKMAFAAVYNAADPSKEEIRAALRILKACHVAGDVNDSEFEQTQAALVARF